ncbi:hypothetical protein EYF80_022830 [Liparis tanakae]|uniref:Uncharacterized protein n=1 Tax=Liparis tanakae TaxID=230148 RepID=A0A4Z2HPK1_9TELE|nr:hypothetical protein EYF80_022830 [Liparis tanakae]
MKMRLSPSEQPQYTDDLRPYSTLDFTEWRTPSSRRDGREEFEMMAIQLISSTLPGGSLSDSMHPPLRANAADDDENKYRRLLTPITRPLGGAVHDAAECNANPSHSVAKQSVPFQQARLDRNLPNIASPRTQQPPEHSNLPNTATSRTPQPREHRNLPNTATPRTPQLLEHRNSSNTATSRTPQLLEHRNSPNTATPRTPQLPEHCNLPNTATPRTPQTPEHRNFPNTLI